MAVVSNTFTTATPVGNREELSDIVNRITPEDTPLYSGMSHGKAASTHPEWETEELRAPAANAQLEGDSYTFDSVTPATRLGNYTQIFRSGWIFSNTQEAVDNAGNAEKFARKKLKAGIELRKDVEFAIVSNTATVAGQTRNFGSLPTWLETNADRGASGADGGYQSDGLTDATTDGTQRAFTKTLLDNTMQSVYEEGGNVSKLVVSPYVKSVFVEFMSDSNVAAFRSSVDGKGKNTIVGTADYYEGPFGKVMVVPNRVMATSATTARNAYLVDDDMLEFKWLRKMKEDPDLAKESDAKKGMLIGEGTLCVQNEKGLGVVADVFGLTAAS